MKAAQETQTVTASPQSPPAPQAKQEHFDEFDRKVLRKNFFYHAVEGGCYMGGSSFIAPNCVLPRIVELLGGPAWMISLAPALTMLGFNTLPVVTAHRIELMKKVMPLVIGAGIFQRAPFFIAGLLLLFLSTQYPWIPLIAVIGAPFFSGIVGGLISTAWQELVAKTVPNKKRSSLFAIRYTISSVIGISAGAVIAAVLVRFPGVHGYGVLYLISSVFLALSFVFFINIKEPVHEHRAKMKRISLIGNLHEMGRIFRSDSRLRRYVYVTSLTNATMIVVPFLPIFILRATGHNDSFLGMLVTAQMVGSIAGNFASGFAGDRWGGKVIMVAGRTVMAISCLAAGFIRIDWAFTTLFFMQGMAGSAVMVGAQTMNIELCPFDKRSTYLAVMAIANVPAIIFFSLIGSTMWDLKFPFSLLAVLAAVLVGLSIAVLWTIPEPRKIGTIKRTV